MPIGILIFVDQSSTLVENSIEGPLKHADLCVTFLSLELHLSTSLLWNVHQVILSMHSTVKLSLA